jgi:hypothetical protein
LALKEGRAPSNPCGHDIAKDINRTFPEQPFFNDNEYGSFG